MGDMIMKTQSSCTIIAIITGLSLLSSCGGAKLTNPWVNSAYEGHYLKNVLVVGISDQFDKRKLEDAFVSQFGEHGVKAISLESTPGKKELTSADVKAEAARLGCDAVFTVHILGITEKEVIDRFNPPPEASPDWSYSFPIYMVQPPPVTYRFEQKHIVMESYLYDTSTGSLMWRVRSEIAKSGSTAKLIDQASRTVIKNLIAAMMIR